MKQERTPIYSKSLALKLEIVARVLAATVGAYAMAWAYTTLMSWALLRAGCERSNAVAWATLTAYLVFLVAAFASFAARSVVVLWSVLVALASVLLLSARLLGST